MIKTQEWLKPEEVILMQIAVGFMPKIVQIRFWKCIKLRFSVVPSFKSEGEGEKEVALGSRV